MTEYLLQTKYWIESSKDDLNSAESIFQNGNYDWSLYIAHLALEKVLKAYFVFSQHKIPPKTHKLDRIAELSSLKLSSQQEELFKYVNEFNIETRYPDYKRKFHKLCTKEFAEKYLNEIKEVYNWLLEQIKE